MFFNLKKFLVQREDFRWASGARGGELAFGVRQNLFQMSRRSHREFRLWVNLRLEIQNPKSLRHLKKVDLPVTLPLPEVRVFHLPCKISISETK
jgi:hypothetical protein